MSRRPLAVDLCCGLGGWSEGLLAEGYDVIGFDIEQHVYGDMRYPGQLVVQDVLTLHGSQFNDASLIVASPPCQFFSYTAMPWTKAKARAAKVRANPLLLAKELALFNACFRIQREACEAAGRHIPLIVENVRGAIPWVGRSRWNFGSFHLWGDVPALMPQALRVAKVPMPAGQDSLTVGFQQMAKLQLFGGSVRDATKVPGFRFDGSGRIFQTASVNEAGSKGGGDWFGSGANCSAQRRAGSKSPARKAASAIIAKIPLPLSRHIAAVYRPRDCAENAA